MSLDRFDPKLGRISELKVESKVLTVASDLNFLLSSRDINANVVPINVLLIVVMQKRRQWQDPTIQSLDSAGVKFATDDG